MVANCTPCETCAGPTIRVYADTVTGPVQLALTITQAIDLAAQIDYAVEEYDLPQTVPCSEPDDPNHPFG